MVITCWSFFTGDLNFLWVIQFHVLKFFVDFYSQVFNFAIFSQSQKHDLKDPQDFSTNTVRYLLCLVSKSGHFLWQSEEYSLKPLKLLLSVLVGSIDEDTTLSIFDPHPSRSVTGLCATIGIDRLYCPVRVFSFLHKNGRKREPVIAVVLRQGRSSFRQRTLNSVKSKFVTDTGCIRKCVKTEFT